MLKKIQGLKYPDEYVVKFFFKAGLDKASKLNVLELGCGNGNNLMLPFHYGHRVEGVDIDAALIASAEHNFKLVTEGNDTYHFRCDDMRSFIRADQSEQVDVLLLPSVVYYISKEHFKQMLDDLMATQLLNTGASLYIRFRSYKDFRHGVGEKVAAGEYRMPTDALTGESDALIAFYSETEMLDVIREKLYLRDYQVFSIDCQNQQSDSQIFNSDIVIWGTVN